MPCNCQQITNANFVLSWTFLLNKGMNGRNQVEGCHEISQKLSKFSVSRNLNTLATDNALSPLWCKTSHKSLLLVRFQMFASTVTDVKLPHFCLPGNMLLLKFIRGKLHIILHILDKQKLSALFSQLCVVP